LPSDLDAISVEVTQKIAKYNKSKMIKEPAPSHATVNSEKLDKPERLDKFERALSILSANSDKEDNNNQLDSIDLYQTLDSI
jgi:hypothetical protein